MKNNRFELGFNSKGHMTKLVLNNDPNKMNWVVDQTYLKQANFSTENHSFGSFTIRMNGIDYSSDELEVKVETLNQTTNIMYSLPQAELNFIYQLDENDLTWKIELINSTDQPMTVQDFRIWTPFNYVMYRINDLDMQTNQSVSVNPSISEDFTKIACIRRSNEAPHLGMFQLEGETKSVGTYCDYVNLFFENASPSLDGILYHQLILAGGYEEGFENSDWIYSKDGFCLEKNQEKKWEYVITDYADQDMFYKKAQSFGHPMYDFEPLAIVNQPYEYAVTLPTGLVIEDAYIEYLNYKGEIQRRDFLKQLANKDDSYSASLIFSETSEHKLTIELNNGKKDSTIINVMKPIKTMIEERTNYICTNLYSGQDGEMPYAFKPISNQGESLGKLSFVLKKNLLGRPDPSEIQKVEESCVHYIRQKWFEHGDFTQPTYLYGDFYRCMDYEYIGHVFYLLSQFDEKILTYHRPDEYLSWAADVFCLRVNPELHDHERGKEEAEMLGTYFLYINDLLNDLKERGLIDKYDEIHSLWMKVTEQVERDSESYKAAVTEHFYDNAGFGPAAGALASSNRLIGAKRYGELLIANIGYANDFRAQNPDRWWEALSYMIHSLWGGLTAAATLKVYEHTYDTRYLKAAYRATAGILYCYDTDAKATDKKLALGEAASTYSVAGPHVNRPDLSRNRFGQSTFYRDGGIFSRLFTKEEETHDWDMGEEMAAYLGGFGTKTFLYEENGEMKVINGAIEHTSKGLVIRSYAPYPLEYHFYDKNVHFVSPDGRFVQEILFADGKFYCN